MVKLLGESSPAKINLFLRITGKRADGYHELDSIFVPVSICDELALELRPNVSSRVTLRCNWASLPDDDRNLAVKAAKSFLDEFRIEAEVMVTLGKRIPMGAGLGGGSSDAASVLRLMAELCRIKDDDRIARLALRLGADVPFFLYRCPARVGGIGERITPLEAFPSMNFVIAVPPFEVPTREVFAGLAPEGWSGPASEDDLAAIMGSRLTSANLRNDLAPVASRRWPAIGELQRDLEEFGAIGAAMTGSGGAVFGVFRSSEEASRAADSMQDKWPRARVFVCSNFRDRRAVD
jgi:4-diphosphocytidyl-2-C-methyl-D-erythritol kinase